LKKCSSKSSPSMKEIADIGVKRDIGGIYDT